MSPYPCSMPVSEPVSSSDISWSLLPGDSGPAQTQTGPLAMPVGSGSLVVGSGSLVGSSLPVSLGTFPMYSLPDGASALGQFQITSPLASGSPSLHLLPGGNISSLAGVQSDIPSVYDGSSGLGQFHIASPGGYIGVVAAVQEVSSVSVLPNSPASVETKTLIMREHLKQTQVLCADLRSLFELNDGLNVYTSERKKKCMGQLQSDLL
ncbi:hypothetical protein B0H11DRAFT_708887 [Mycena galericulata]|nr:hypothetical protein B0H11DRAFT_708887 [Mycena galericulata]